MATASQHVPLDVYLRSSWEPDAEYVDGEIQERAVGELDHAAWQRAIQKWFFAREEEWRIRVFVELRVQVAATRFRVPDVVVLENRGALEAMGQIVTEPPCAVFEILSPEDTLPRTMEKLDDYAAMGVRGIFVIDPRARKKYQYEPGSLKQVTTAGISAHQQGHIFNLDEFEQYLS